MPDMPVKRFQWRAVFDLGDAVDARRLRLELAADGVVPAGVLDALAFFGHRRSLNVAALAPTGNALAEVAVDIAAWLAQRYSTFVPTSLEAHELGFDYERGYQYAIPAVVVARSGESWTRAADPRWQAGYLLRRFAADVERQLTAWGLRIPAVDDAAAQGLKVPDFSLVSTGKTLPVKVPVRGKTGNAETTVLCVTDVRFTLPLKLQGYWAIGPLQGLGFGRAAFEVPTMTVDEQLEALA